MLTPCRAVGLASPFAFCFVTQTRSISALHITVSVTPALCLLWNMCLIFFFFYCRWRGTKASSAHCLIEFYFIFIFFRILNKLRQFSPSSSTCTSSLFRHRYGSMGLWCLIFFFFFWLLLERHQSLFSSLSYRILNKLKQFPPSSSTCTSSLFRH